MNTDVIKVFSDGTGRTEALEQVDKFSEYVGLDEKQDMRLRLLVEETLGMVAAITHDFRGDYWLEHSDDGVCRIHLRAETIMDLDKKEQLINVSTSGKNEAAKGFMGKIKDIFQNGIIGIEEANKASLEYGLDPYTFAYMGAAGIDGMGVSSATHMHSWSLQNYRQRVEQEKDSDPRVCEAWDELEKSIVASIADEVKVSVSGSTAELVIEKKFK